MGISSFLVVHFMQIRSFSLKNSGNMILRSLNSLHTKKKKSGSFKNCLLKDSLGNQKWLIAAKNIFWTLNFPGVFQTHAFPVCILNQWNINDVVCMWGSKFSQLLLWKFLLCGGVDDVFSARLTRARLLRLNGSTVSQIVQKERRGNLTLQRT